MEMKLKDKKLRKRLEKIFPHSEECIRVIKELRGVLKMFHPGPSIDPMSAAMAPYAGSLMKMMLGGGAPTPQPSVTPPVSTPTYYFDPQSGGWKTR